MTRPAVEAGMTVDEAMRLWPALIAVFIQHRMLCVGCPVSRFHTIGDACAAHGIEAGDFLDALRVEIRASR